MFRKHSPSAIKTLSSEIGPNSANFSTDWLVLISNSKKKKKKKKKKPSKENIYLGVHGIKLHR